MLVQYRELALILVRYAPNLNEDLSESVRYDTFHKAKGRTGDMESSEIAFESGKGILDTPLMVSSHSRHAVEELSCPKTTLFRELIKRMPHVAIEALERCIERSHVGGSKVEVTMNYRHIHHETNLREGEGICKRKTKEDDLVDPLQIIVDNERTFLLKHPVVRSYVYEKWKTLGLWLYLSYYGVFFAFFSLLALFSIVVPHPLVIDCDFRNETTTINDDLTETPKCGSPIGTRVLAIFVVLLAVYHLGLEAYWLITRFTDYFLNITNYFQLGLYISAILFVTSAIEECGCPMKWQWHFGIISVALGTLNLIVLSSNFPLVSIYVIMYTEILVTFMRLVVFGMLLMCAFALIMYMMFRNPNASYSNFKDPGYAFLSTLDMTTSPGVDLNTLFNLNDSTVAKIPFHYLNIVMWILLLLFFPLVFNNMLTSLAVDDVKKVREKAELKQVALQVQVFTDTKYILSSGILRYLMFQCKSTRRKVQQMKKYIIQLRIREQQHFWRELWHSALGWICRRAFGDKKFLQDIEDDSYDKKRQVEIALLKGRRFDTQGFARERVNDLHAMISALKTDIARK